MNKKNIIIPAVICLQVCNGIVAYGKLNTKTEKTNFLLILTDDQSYHLSLIGTPGLHTPNIDGLARGGMFFTKAYAAAASCSPCRSVILTGMYPHSNGHWRNTITPGLNGPDIDFSRQSSKLDPVGVHEDLPTLIEVLNTNGYFTGITSKFHLSPPWKYPFKYRSARGGGITQRYTETLDFLEKTGDQPFFFQVNIGYTHRNFSKSSKTKELQPVDPKEVKLPSIWPDTEITREDYADYLTAVEHADASIGQVLKALQASGKAENTIVIYTSDQGYSYHRAKATTYDWGVHVPLSFTGKSIKKGIITQELASHTDIAPTILDFAGISIPKTIQGKSLRNFLEGKKKTTGEKYVFSEHNAHGNMSEEYYPTRTITDGRYRYIRNLRYQIVPDYPIERFVTDTVFAEKQKWLPWTCWDATPGRTWGNRAFAEIINNRERFPMAYELLKSSFFRLAEELYDLENDPYEMKNLAENQTFTKEKKRLSSALDNWMKETGDDGDPRSHPRRTTK